MLSKEELIDLINNKEELNNNIKFKEIEIKLNDYINKLNLIKYDDIIKYLKIEKINIKKIIYLVLKKEFYNYFNYNSFYKIDNYKNNKYDIKNYNNLFDIMIKNFEENNEIIENSKYINEIYNKFNDDIKNKEIIKINLIDLIYKFFNEFPYQFYNEHNIFEIINNEIIFKDNFYSFFIENIFDDNENIIEIILTNIILENNIIEKILIDNFLYFNLFNYYNRLENHCNYFINNILSDYNDNNYKYNHYDDYKNIFKIIIQSLIINECINFNYITKNNNEYEYEYNKTINKKIKIYFYYRYNDDEYNFEFIEKKLNEFFNEIKQNLTINNFKIINIFNNDNFLNIINLLILKYIWNKYNKDNEDVDFHYNLDLYLNSNKDFKFLYNSFYNTNY